MSTYTALVTCAWCGQNTTANIENVEEDDIAPLALKFITSGWTPCPTHQRTEWLCPSCALGKSNATIIEVLP